MRSILITTDLSEHSKPAFKQAKLLASAFKSTIIALTVFEDSLPAAICATEFPVTVDPRMRDDLRRKAEKELDTLCDELLNGLTVERTVHETLAPVHQAIAEFAAIKNVDLIVMSTHGRSGLARLITGSVTESVIRNAPCPILCVPPER